MWGCEYAGGVGRGGRQAGIPGNPVFLGLQTSRSSPAGLAAELCFPWIKSKTSHKLTAAYCPFMSSGCLCFRYQLRGSPVVLSLVPSQGCRELTLSPRAAERHPELPWVWRARRSPWAFSGPPYRMLPLLQQPTKFTYMKTEFGHLHMWVPLPLLILMPMSYL